MREFTIETKTTGFSGTLTLKVPTIAERFAIIKDMGIIIDPEKGVNVEAMKSDLGMLAKIITVISTLVVSVNLKYGEKEITDKDDLQYYMEAMPVYFEVLTFAVQGLTLGKN